MKKTVVTCDYCGKEMTTWLEVSISIDALYSQLNVYDLLEYAGKQHICKDCADKLYYAAFEVKRIIGTDCNCELFHRVNNERAVCWGTKDADVCHCNGNKAKCENIDKILKI